MDSGAWWATVFRVAKTRTGTEQHFLSFFLELFSPLFPCRVLDIYLPRGLSFSILSFCFFILFMGFLRQKY